MEFIVDPNVELATFRLNNGRITRVDGEWVVDHADVTEDESVFQASGEEFMPRYLGFSGGCDAHVGLPWV